MPATVASSSCLRSASSVNDGVLAPGKAALSSLICFSTAWMSLSILSLRTFTSAVIGATLLPIVSSSFRSSWTSRASVSAALSSTVRLACIAASARAAANFSEASSICVPNVVLRAAVRRSSFRSKSSEPDAPADDADAERASTRATSVASVSLSFASLETSDACMARCSETLCSAWFAATSAVRSAMFFSDAWVSLASAS